MLSTCMLLLRRTSERMPDRVPVEKASMTAWCSAFLYSACKQ